MKIVEEEVSQENLEENKVKVAREIQRGLVGLSESEAVEKITSHNLKYRVAKRDGEPAMLTMDYRRDRINLSINGDVIVEAKIG